MLKRLPFLLALALFVSPALAKDKKKILLPEDVLRARTVRVVIDRDAGEPLDQPYANSVARENVEKALNEWGRFRLVMDGLESDLIIEIRTGNGNRVRPTIKGGPLDQRPGVAQGTDSTIRIAGQHGQPPYGDPNSDPIDRGPHISNEVGPSQDTFTVYRGATPDPLNAPAVWRYSAKDCLSAPSVTAVEEFRKLIAQAEKQQASKTP